MNSSAGQRLANAFAFYISVCLLAMLGLWLRWRAAQGELWLDEVWSMTLVAPLRHAGQVFWAISHDNNHFLNSLWLFAMGPDASVTSLRSLSIAFGGLAVLAAGWAGYGAKDGARAGASWFSGLIAALFCALGLAFVDHGSEARGYSGLITCAFVACGAWLRAVKADEFRMRWLWLMALATGLACLFHLTGVALAAVLGLAHLAVLRGRTGDMGAAFRQCVREFWPMALALTPAFASLAAGVAVTGKLTVGGLSPFSWERFLHGFAGMLVGLAGFLPEGMLIGGGNAGPALVIIGAAAVIFMLLLAKGLLGREIAALGICGLVIMPLAMALARLPNLEFARYFLVPAVIAVLVLAQGARALWRRGGANRAAGVAILLLAGLVNGAALPGYLASSRGQRLPLLEAIARSGDPSYATNSRMRVPMMAQFLARRSGLVIRHVEEIDICQSRPLWFIGETADVSRAPPQIEAGPKACPQVYVSSGMASTGRAGGWVLYQRQEVSP